MWLRRSLYGSEGQHNGVTVGVGNLAPGTGAQAQLTGYEYNSAGVANLALIHVTIDEHTTGQVLAIAVAHEGYHVGADQAAVSVWTATGSYQQARSSPLNLTTYDNENNAYHISAYMAMALGRSELTYAESSGRSQIWRQGMRNVDQQALNGLLSGHYHVTPTSRGSTILP